VVKTFGRIETASVLISALRLTAQTDPNKENENDTRSAEALHQCLVEVTGVDGPGGSALNRSEFWSRWWREKAIKIVSDKTPLE